MGTTPVEARTQSRDGRGHLEERLPLGVKHHDPQFIDARTGLAEEPGEALPWAGRMGSRRVDHELGLFFALKISRGLKTQGLAGLIGHADKEALPRREPVGRLGRDADDAHDRRGLREDAHHQHREKGQGGDKVSQGTKRGQRSSVRKV